MLESMINALTGNISTTQFFSLVTEMKLRVVDKLLRIKNTFPTISVENAIARTSAAECPSFNVAK